MPNHYILDLQPAHTRELKHRDERAMAEHGYDSPTSAARAGAAPRPPLQGGPETGHQRRAGAGRRNVPEDFAVARRRS